MFLKIGWNLTHYIDGIEGIVYGAGGSQKAILLYSILKY